MSNKLLAETSTLKDELTSIRRDIHSHPELGREEFRTSAIVADHLRSWGLTVTEGVGGTGVVGTLKGSLSNRGAIALRADMDALALEEQSGKPYSSKVKGVMHACGHDGHIAMLLGAALHLSRNPHFDGTVHFVFQPAEEGRGGAKAMLADGLFDRFPTTAVYGLHNMPTAPLGSFHTRPGPMMAAGDRWNVTFRGTGGHGGAAPHESTDVMLLQAQFIVALQSVVSRNVAAVDAAVISVGSVQGGSPSALNVMPAEVVVGGVCRSYTPEVRDKIERRIRELACGLATTFGCTAEIDYRRHGTALVNHPHQTAAAVAAATALVGCANVRDDLPPITGGEDFASMLQVRPGNFVFLGQGTKEKGGEGLHRATYDFNDDAIPFGVGYWVSLVLQELGGGQMPLPQL